MLIGTLLFALVSIKQGPDYVGMCDASAAIPLSQKLFVVGNDEDNVLRIYDADEGGEPKAAIDLTSFLKVDLDHPEADIEGATRVGNTVYWIASHGRNKNGKPRPGRRRFFATTIVKAPTGVSVKPTGRPFEGLVAAALAEPSWKAVLGDADQHAPETEGGLNIEGLTRRPDGSLLVGFRSPLLNGRALLLPLKNPSEIVQGKPPRLGPPIALDLAETSDGERRPAGIRSIEFVDGRNAYLIVAGPSGDEGQFRLYEWSGRDSDRPVLLTTIASGSLNPEALIVYAPLAAGVPGRLQLLSDDGDRPIAGSACKDLADPKMKRFRSAFVE